MWEGESSGVPATVTWNKRLHGSDLSMGVSGPWGDSFCQCCMKDRQQCMQSLQCLHCMVDQNWTYMYNTHAQPCTPTPSTLSLVYITACIMGQGDPYHQPTTSHNTHTIRASHIKPILTLLPTTSPCINMTNLVSGLLSTFCFHSQYNQTNKEHSSPLWRNRLLSYK